MPQNRKDDLHLTWSVCSSTKRTSSAKDGLQCHTMRRVLDRLALDYMKQVMPNCIRHRTSPITAHARQLWMKRPEDAFHSTKPRSTGGAHRLLQKSQKDGWKRECKQQLWTTIQEEANRASQNYSPSLVWPGVPFVYKNHYFFAVRNCLAAQKAMDILKERGTCLEFHSLDTNHAMSKLQSMHVNHSLTLHRKKQATLRSQYTQLWRLMGLRLHTATSQCPGAVAQGRKKNKHLHI